MTALVDGLKSLGVARLIAMAAVAVGMLAMLTVVALRGGTSGERMALLYSDLDLRESAQVLDHLDRAHIPRQVEGQGERILVPEGQVAAARLLLAKDGLPSGGSIGYEIFDRDDGLTASQFQQGVSQTRALQGELARSIRMITGVRNVRVHLVLPRREPFARERQDSQASVMLTMAGNARMDRESVQAVLNLVAAAVPGLRPQNIAVIDSRGNVLARSGEPLGAGTNAQSNDELRRTTELRLSRAVEEMLERSLGPGKVRAEAAVEMDVDRISETQERFDPEQQVLRSQQTVSDTSRTTEANSTVSVQNNLPNADAGQDRAGTSQQRQEETNNYEIGKTVRTLVREQPQIRRISLAVLIDGIETRAADGTVAWRERNAEEIGRIATLVRGAIGFNEQRGDHVEIVSMRLTGTDEAPAADTRHFLGLPVGSAEIGRLIETALLAVIAMIAILLVLRPMVLRLTGPQSASSHAAMIASEDGDMSAATMLTEMRAGEGGLALAAPGGRAMLPGPAGAAGALAMSPGGNMDVSAVGAYAGEDESMVNLANIEGAMRASSIRRIAELVDKHPEESLQILRSWMAQEAA